MVHFFEIKIFFVKQADLPEYLLPRTGDKITFFAHFKKLDKKTLKKSAKHVSTKKRYILDQGLMLQVRSGEKTRSLVDAIEPER